MLTPIFSLSQDDDFIHLQIKAPHASIKECDMQFEDRHFIFFARPYFLRLHFPKEVVQDGREEAKWDSEKGQFLIKIPKLHSGDFFEDLDMLTKLLTNPRKTGPTIEVIESTTAEDCEDFDWTLEQTIRSDEEEAPLLQGYKYGFANTKAGIFTDSDCEISLAIDLKDPERKSVLERRSERIASESDHFDDDHYLTSLFEDRFEIDELIKFRAFWDDVSPDFSESEIFQLKNFRRKEFILNREEKKRAFLGLIDLLYAYAYDFRTTEGEHTSESNWTICKLSPTLSWLESHDNLKETLMACIRRSLCYPLHRDWKLAIKVVEDVQTILKSGKKCVLKCLLAIHGLLNKTVDSRYILNDLYVTDYCIWIQTVTEKTLEQLGESVKSVAEEITKDDVDLDIVLLEAASQEALREQNVSELASHLEVVKLK